MSRKGGAFERLVCETLSEWWTGEPDKSVFWRTANSGGRATIRHRKKKKTSGQFGDICATDPIGQPLIDTFMFELKNGYSKHTLSDLVDKGRKNKPMYEKWIKKASKSAEECGAETWLLIHKRDGRVPMIFWTNHYVYTVVMREWESIVQAPFNQEGRNPSLVYGMPLDRFLLRFRPEHVREMPRDRVRIASELPEAPQEDH